MSTALVEPGQDAALLEEIAGMQQRLNNLEREVARLKVEGRVQQPLDWRAAIERMQRGWASMEPEHQAECRASFEEVRRRLREADGDQ